MSTAKVTPTVTKDPKPAAPKRAAGMDTSKDADKK